MQINEKYYYKLSVVQIVCNPIEVLPIRLCMFGFIISFPFTISLDPVPPIIVILFALLFLFLFKLPLISFFADLRMYKADREFLLERDAVCVDNGYGYIRLSSKLCKVSKGLLGTYLLRWPQGYFIVIPKGIGSRDEIEKLIYRNNSVEK